MDATDKSTTRRKRRQGAPAKTEEGRERQLISLAVDLAEEQLSKGTASAQVIVHYLKLGTTTSRLEREKLQEENKLLRARTEALQSQKRIEDLYANALEAMRSYRGDSSRVEDDLSDDQDL